MNRNHQGRNDQKRTKQGRHHLAYRQLGKSYQHPTYDTYSERYGNYRYEGAYNDDRKYNLMSDDEWESEFNQGPERRKNKPRHLSPDNRWNDNDEPVTTSEGYADFHRSGEPVLVNPKEKYRHQRVQNTERDFHGQGLSYRARSDRHPERFLKEDESDRTARISYAGMGPKGYRRSDSSLEEEVCEVLTRDPQIDASEIVVAVEDGTVKLSGTVENREERFDIERAVDGIWGVEEIMNDIKVRRRSYDYQERH